MSNTSLSPLSMDDFFLEKDNLISSEMCEEILSRYSRYLHTSEAYPEQPSRSSKLLSELDMLPEIWSDILDELEPLVKEQIENYLEKFLTSNPAFYIFSHATIRRFTSTITEEIHYNTEFAVNHSEVNPIRNFFCILYLTEPKMGGEHAFPLQSKFFIPKKGKLMIYPTSFMFPNMSLPCYGDPKILIRFNYHLDINAKSLMEQYEA